MDIIYEGRRLATFNRETRTLQTQSSHGSPVSTLAIELIVEQIASERKPAAAFHDLVLSYTADGQISRTLQSMSLVHSSWTIASQRHLRQRIEGSAIVVSKPSVGPMGSRTTV